MNWTTILWVKRKGLSNGLNGFGGKLELERSARFPQVGTWQCHDREPPASREKG